MKKNLLSLFVLLLLGIGTITAQFTDLYTFNHPTGAEPFGTLTASPAKVLYGTAYLGGANDSGCIFAINANGNSYRDIFDFNGPNGTGPNSPLTLIGHKLFGSANGGGANDSGCIFSIDSNGNNYRDLFDFSGPNGKNPYNTLIFDSASGVLFGIADGGANHVGCIFSIDTNGGSYRDLFDFTIATGEYPLGLTLLGHKLYGTTLEGGLYSYGLVFSIDTNGTSYNDLFDFDNSNGLFPYGALTYSNGLLFGATADGGTFGYGILFSIDTNGSHFKDIFNFNSTDGAQPEYAGGAPTISGNKIFGTTYYGAAHDSGSIFSIDTTGNAYKDLYDFTGPNGSNPEGSLTFVGSTLYGATAYGGTNHLGVIYTYDTAVAVATAIRDSICKGDSSLLYVSGLSGATYLWSPGGQTSDSIYVKPALNATYTVTSLQGVTSYTNTVAVTVITLPAPVIAGTSSKCIGITDTLTVSGGTTYLWSNGSTQATYYTGPINADSTIHVTAYNSFGCSDTASFTITAMNCATGFSEVQNNPEFQVFPNPSNGVFTVQLSVVSGQSSVIEVYNMLGERILTQSLTGSETQVNMGKQAPGVYLYRILSEQGKLIGENKLEIQ